MKLTNIEWTDFSANPLKYRDRRTGAVVWGCVKKSSGCANCYSEALALRYDRGGPFTRATMEHLEPFLDEKELRQILTAKTVDKRAVAGSKCFLGDMTDVFGEWVPDEILDRLFAVMALRPDVTFQVLTKRADRMRDYFKAPDRKRLIAEQAMPLSNMLASAAGSHAARLTTDQFREAFVYQGPVPNVWLGVSVENQAAADVRIPHLIDTPAAVRFLSCEPLLGAVGIRDPLTGDSTGRETGGAQGWQAGPAIDWVIVGGESGAGARPMQLDWARSLVEQCRAADVPCFVKQLGAAVKCGPHDAEEGAFPRCWRCGHFDFGPCTNGVLLCNGCDAAWDRLRDRKGGNPDEWPANLRVREFPREVRAAC